MAERPPIEELTFLRHLAQLAHLALTKEEEARYRREFQEIVAYVGQVELVEASLRPLTATVTGVRSVLREDRVESSALGPALLKHAPAVQDGCVRVPAIR